MYKLRIAPTKPSFTLAILVLCLLFQGCAATPIKPVFYPGEPDPPRYQYLKSISNASDIGDSILKKAFAEGLFSFNKAFGIAAYKNTLLVTDTRYKGYAVLNFETGDLKFVSQDSSNRHSKMLAPFGITVDKSGNRYIADLNAHRVLMFSADDRYIKSFDFDKTNSSPTGILANGSKLYVTQLKQGRIDVLDINSGKLLQSISDGAQLAWPSDIGQFNNDLYVIDMLRYQVVHLSPKGEFIRAFGKAGDSTGNLARPKGIALDDQGRLLVVDAAFENFQIFRNDGQLLGFVSKGGGAPENLYLPAGICISYDLAPYFQKYAATGFKLEYIVAVANQTGPSKINIYGFGKLEGATYAE